ncbi:MAG: bestrophin family protein [Microcystaceae cyanobacterium]
MDLLKKQNWLITALSWRGSVVPAILPRTLLCVVFSLIVLLFYYRGFFVGLAPTASILLNLVLGLLLVFRTNTAYERFWEGRRLWGNLINNTRNLARNIWVIILENDPQDRQNKEAALDLLVAFAIAMKTHLRQESLSPEISDLVSSSQYEKLQTINNPALEIALWIQDYLQHQYHRHRVNLHQLSDLQQLLNGMVDTLGGCERILKTPIPLAYAIHLRQLLLIYCLLLPFQFVKEFGWYTIVLVAILSFTLFGVEEIGIEIENPFGRDPNDLKLDDFCDTIQRNLNDLKTVEPYSAKNSI